MDPKQLFDALQKRTSMRVVRRVLAKNGFPRGQGWDQVKEKLKDKRIAAKADYQGLQDGLRELLIAGDKAVRVFKLSRANAASLRAAVSKLKIAQTNEFSKHFPYPVPDSVLLNLPPQPAVPVAKFHGAQGEGILFSSLNIIEIRERLTAAQLGATAAAYDEVIGIKKVKFQTFDALIVSKTKDYAYVLTDAHLDTTQGTRRALQSNVREAVNSMVGSKVLAKPVNLLPFIEPIYNSNDGLVKRLHYTTTTESGRQEWMRGSGNCLRAELSHKAGMQALSGAFKGYAIEIEYPLQEVEGYTPRPLVSILGLYRMTYELDPAVDDATIWGCATIAEFEQTLAELMYHVSGSKSI
jgi:hypothetical protein